MAEMTGLLYVAFNAFSIAVLLMMFNYIFKGVDKRMEQVMFAWFIISSVILCTSDIFWGVFEFWYGWETRPELSFVANAIYHIFTCVVSYLWFLYSETKQKSKTVTTKIGLILTIIPLLLVIFLVAGSFVHRWVFYIAEDGSYHRGNHYFLLVIVCCSYIFITAAKAFFKAFKKENYINKQSYLALASFIIYPTICMILQVIFVGSPMISAGIVLSVLSVYTNSREQLISVDPMTGLNNRTHMEKYLDQKMKNRSDNKELIIFIMDLDYFKKINDNYGHVEGDKAIIIAANTLKTIAGKNNFLASRYGGDEFVVIAETNKDYNPKDFIIELNDLLSENTLKEGKDYFLHFSVGYKHFSPEFTDVPSFIKAADEGLYVIKNSNHHYHRTHIKDML